MDTVDLHSDSVLVYVTASVWTARRLDKKASRTLNRDAGASQAAARVHKNLLADADQQLKNILAKVQAARRLVDDNTLPWDDVGYRICSNARVLKLAAEFDEVRQQFANEVNHLLTIYPALREDGMRALGDLATPEDYPDVLTLRDKFRLRLSITPCASTFVTAVRRGITDEQTALLERHYQARVRGQQEAALTAAWQRLKDDAELLASRLAVGSDGKREHRLRDATVENLRDTARTLKELNVFKSEALDTLCGEVETMLHGVTVDTLRSSDTAAEKTRLEAEALVDKLAAMFG